MKQDTSSPILEAIDAFLTSPTQQDVVWQHVQVFAPGVKRQHLQTWFRQFGNGIAYVIQRCAPTANNLFIIDTLTYQTNDRVDSEYIGYVSDRDIDGIVITHKALANSCENLAKNTPVSLAHLPGVWVSDIHYPFLLGIAVAYQGYITKSFAKKRHVKKVKQMLSEEITKAIKKFCIPTSARPQEAFS